MQKVCFSDKENLPHPKIGKTQHNAFLKLNASLPKGRSAGRPGKLRRLTSIGARRGARFKFRKCLLSFSNDPREIEFYKNVGTITKIERD
ncbi:hypothetical protein LEP1GSC089_0436 [Leptospira interrogans serovar Autumnalis str. LP101]|nr:hypothetical protein LEP1GSC089_0436 [Leptospira interrogans serovar Autumnalis str. LP101]